MALIKIPEYAKRNAEKGLRMRRRVDESEKFGLTRSEAEEKGVSSGVERAQQLKSQESIRTETGEDIYNFLSRFHGMADEHSYTTKIYGSILLWGGDKDKRFLKYLERKLNKN